MSEDVFQVLDRFVSAPDVPTLLQYYDQLVSRLNLKPLIGSKRFFLHLKTYLLTKRLKELQKFQKILQIFQKLEKRSKLKFYHDEPLNGQRILVIGGGISGLRLSIEMLLLGSKEVLCVEKRFQFSRNNVIHLWPNVIQDMKQLAAKRFYPKFCSGSIDHISIRQLQLILLKVCLLFGLKFQPKVTFAQLCPQMTSSTTTTTTTHDVTINCSCCCHSHGFGEGACAHFLDAETGLPFSGLRDHFFDVIVGADGRRNTLFQDFPRKEFRGKLAIAVTANFVNRRSESESRAEEISGVSYIYHQKWFKKLLEETGIQLENICYYRDETHYFVMTATKASLLKREVLIKDFSDTNTLLSEDNIDRGRLLHYARDAAQWTSGLKGLEFAKNANQSPDVALFDFTSVYAARNASRAKRIRLTCCDTVRAEHVAESHVLMMLCGDSLLEPFWPTGSGAGRGFLSALDAAYCALQWTKKVVKSDLKGAELMERMRDVIAERESIYRLLAQTTPENIQSKEFCLFPEQRYQNWNKNSIKEIKNQIFHLIGQNQPISEHQISLNAKRARRATVAVTSRDLNVENQSEDREMELEQKWRQMDERRRSHEEEGAGLVVKRRPMREKEAWLLGKSERKEEMKKRNEEIIERAKELEKMISEREKGMYHGKLAKVGKIEENDWNFKVWEKKREKENEHGDKCDRKELIARNKAILESRKTQIEEKMKEINEKKDEKSVKKMEKKGIFVEMIGKELKQKMKEKDEKMIKKTTNMTTETTTDVKKCKRCDLEVSAVERIQVSGDILHRSCLRCSKCGISLRLNEFRNELKFLCVFCLKNNSKNCEKNENSLKAKQKFLSEIEKIDFRSKERDFRSKDNENCLKIISKTALNSKKEEKELNSSESDDNWTTDEDDDDDSDNDDNDDTNDSEEWITESEEEENDLKENLIQIPSIRVTKEDNNRDDIRTTTTTEKTTTGYRYSGQFTEKLFRSKSQPLLILKRFNRQKLIEDNVLDDDILDDSLPFADIEGLSGHFSPVKSLQTKAPIIEFKDI